MKKEIQKLIDSLEATKKMYEKIILEEKSQKTKDFFAGKIAGLHDEVCDLKWLLKNEDVDNTKQGE